MTGPKYPLVELRLTGRDGNVFAIIGAVTKALRWAGEPDAAAEYAERAFACQSYDEVLRLTKETVNVS